MSDSFTRHDVHIVATPPVASAMTEDSAVAITGPAVGLVLRKRIRQIETHGYTPAHDLAHDGSEIALGAMAFVHAGLALAYGVDATRPFAVAAAREFDAIVQSAWPFDGELNPPGDEVECYVNAAAMLLAEIDRVLAVRAAARTVLP